MCQEPLLITACTSVISRFLLLFSSGCICGVHFFFSLSIFEIVQEEVQYQNVSSGVCFCISSHPMTYMTLVISASPPRPGLSYLHFSIFLASRSSFGCSSRQSGHHSMTSILRATKSARGSQRTRWSFSTKRMSRSWASAASWRGSAWRRKVSSKK